MRSFVFVILLRLTHGFSVADNRQEGTSVPNIPIFTIHDFQSEVRAQSHSLSKDEENLMQGLVSPAHESFLILKKALMRLKCSATPQEEIYGIYDFESLVGFLVKPDYICILERNTWEMKMTFGPNEEVRSSSKFYVFNPEDVVNFQGDNASIINETSPELYHTKSTKDIAKLALSAVSLNPTYQTELVDSTLRNIELQAIKRLSLTLGSDLRGTSAADAAFCFALSGITNMNIYEALLNIAYHELTRTSQRSTSFKQKDIFHLIEKFAVCNIHTSTQQKLYKLAADTLINKGYVLKNTSLINLLRSDENDLLFYLDRPRLWLFRHSVRQAKVKPEQFDQKYFSKMINWDEQFVDSSKPLVVDIGCGLGVSLLSLSRLQQPYMRTNAKECDINWSACNFVGADLNPSLLRYPKGIAARLEQHLRDRLCFLHLPAMILLEKLKSYPGPVVLIMIQYPSPYILSVDPNQNNINSTRGNTQLSSLRSEGFMVSPELIQLAAQIIQKDGQLLIQTKCEDVAVELKNMAVTSGDFECIPFQEYVEDIERLYMDESCRRPKRVDKWLSLKNGSKIERAQGPTWSSKFLLPAEALSETEVHANIEKIISHRALLRLSSSDV